MEERERRNRIQEGPAKPSSHGLRGQARRSPDYQVEAEQVEVAAILIKEDPRRRG